jgi:hypothetical protein
MKRLMYHALSIPLLLSAFSLQPSAFGQTPVLFPVNSLFGGAAYNQPITLTAANTLISDGQNLWAGTYTIIPAGTTNQVLWPVFTSDALVYQCSERVDIQALALAGSVTSGTTVSTPVCAAFWADVEALLGLV